MKVASPAAVRPAPRSPESASSWRAIGHTVRPLALVHLLLALLHPLDALLEALLAALEALLAPLHPLLGSTGRRQAETDLLQRLVHAFDRLRPVAAVFVTRRLQVLARAFERLLGGDHVRMLLGAHRAGREQADGDQDEQDSKFGHSQPPITGSFQRPARLNAPALQGIAPPMATVITSECINCGACEPECPNTAIYQGAVE